MLFYHVWLVLIEFKTRDRRTDGPHVAARLFNSKVKNICFENSVLQFKKKSTMKVEIQMYRLPVKRVKTISI